MVVDYLVHISGRTYSGVIVKVYERYCDAIKVKPTFAL